jgi:hypothetical protein
VETRKSLKELREYCRQNQIYEVIGGLNDTKRLVNEILYLYWPIALCRFRNVACSTGNKGLGIRPVNQSRA